MAGGWTGHSGDAIPEGVRVRARDCVRVAACVMGRFKLERGRQPPRQSDSEAHSTKLVRRQSEEAEMRMATCRFHTYPRSFCAPSELHLRKHEYRSRNSVK
eukprot:2657367-Pleurochrysis_carterae.AAC.1